VPVPHPKPALRRSPRRPSKGPGRPRRAPRRRLDAEQARDAILDAAAELLVENGPDGLRLTEVAARAGVAHANISYHFGSAAGLQASLARRIAADLSHDVAKLYQGERTAEGAIAMTTARTFEAYDAGGYARLLAWIALSGERPTFESLGEQLAAICAIISAQLGLMGDADADQRRRVVAAVQLVILAAVGNGLIGSMLEPLLPPDPARPTIPEFLSEVFLARLGGQHAAASENA